MGEDNKEKAEEKKEEGQEIVLKVDMHCEACARKVARSLKGFEGVEDVTTDYIGSKVVVKGKTADPVKVCERIQKKIGRKVELISPLPKPPKENKEEKPEEKAEEKKEEYQLGEETREIVLKLVNVWSPWQPPAVKELVLKARMHCEACAQLLQKRIRKIQGVESVTTDLSNDKIIVKGILDPAKLVDDVYKKTKKQVTIVKDEKKEEKKEEAKKEEEKKEAEEDKKSDEMKRSENWATRNYIHYHYAYPTPHIFSDENPNACSVM